MRQHEEARVRVAEVEEESDGAGHRGEHEDVGQLSRSGDGGEMSRHGGGV